MRVGWRYWRSEGTVGELRTFPRGGWRSRNYGKGRGRACGKGRARGLGSAAITDASLSLSLVRWSSSEGKEKERRVGEGEWKSEDQVRREWRGGVTRFPTGPVVGVLQRPRVVHVSPPHVTRPVPVARPRRRPSSCRLVIQPSPPVAFFLLLSPFAKPPILRPP